MLVPTWLWNRKWRKYNNGKIEANERSIEKKDNIDKQVGKTERKRRECFE